MQRLKGALRRVAALGTGVALFGATLTGALAQLDLKNYPAPFVVDGTYDTANAIVVGAKAAASDTLAAVDIASNLQFESKTCVAKGSGSQVSVNGDAVQISDGSDLLELDEPIGEVRETLTDIELNGLRSGTLTTNEGSTTYNQYIRFSDANTSIVSPGVNFTTNDDVSEQAGDFLVVKKGSGAANAFFEYQLEFEQGFESKVTSGALPDLKNKEIVIMGQTYVVVSTTVDTSANSVKLVMLGGSVFDTLQEGEVKTFTVNGKDYEVEVLIVEDVTPPTVTLVVNGEVTDQLNAGETQLLKDGTMLGVSTIVTNEAGEAGSGDIVELYVGAHKLELKDTDYTDSLYSQNVKIDDETISQALVQIKATETDSATRLELSSIKYRLNADPIPGQTDIYVPPGHGVREYLKKPQGMLGDWDIKYEGLDDTGISVIKFNPTGDDEYDMTFENRQGNIYTFPLITTRSGIFKYGDAKNDLVFVEGNITVDGTPSDDIYNIGQNDYLLLSNFQKTAQDKTAFSHVVRYTGIDTANNQLTFDDLATGARDFPYTVTTTAATLNTGLILGQFNLVIGGNTYTGYIQNDTNQSRTANNQFPIAIDMNADGVINRTETRVTINGGGILDLGNQSASAGYIGSNNLTNATNNGNATNTPSGVSAAVAANLTTDGFLPILTGDVVNLTLRTLSTLYDEDGPTSAGASDGASHFMIELNRSGNELGIPSGSVLSNDGLTSRTSDDNRDHKFFMEEYGTFWDLFDPSGTNDAESLTIEFPLKQRGARVFVAIGDTSSTKTNTGEVCTVADITPRTLLDTEVSSPTDYNIVAVGGPCANDLVAQIAGFPTCEGYRSMYKDGEAIIQLAENGDKVALLVAGYNAIDTRKAGKVLANWGDYSLAGSKVKVTGTLGSPSVSLG